MTITDEELDALEKGLEGVTPGPWLRQESQFSKPVTWVSDSGGLEVAEIRWARGAKGSAHRDAAHIARCDPDTIRRLIARLREAEKARDEAQKAFETFRDVDEELRARGWSEPLILALEKYDDELRVTIQKTSHAFPRASKWEAEGARDEVTGHQIRSTPVPRSESESFDRADWFWSALDPDDCDSNPFNVAHQRGAFVVCEIACSFMGPTRYGFIAPVNDPDSDDEEFLHFATMEEAVQSAKAIHAALSKAEAE